MEKILSENYEKLKKEIEKLINQFSIENASDTPDYIIANYLIDCLIAFNSNVKRREHWYGRCVQDDDKSARQQFEIKAKTTEELALEFCKQAAEINARRTLASREPNVTPEQLLEQSDLSYRDYMCVKMYFKKIRINNIPETVCKISNNTMLLNGKKFRLVPATTDWEIIEIYQNPNCHLGHNGTSLPKGHIIHGVRLGEDKFYVGNIVREGCIDRFEYRDGYVQAVIALTGQHVDIDELEYFTPKV